MLSSFLFLCFGCGSAYKGLQPVQADANCVRQFRPVFKNELYNTSVDVVGKHLSGLLLIKQMPDSSMRMVFSNEMGVKFFDFEFTGKNGFRVHHIMAQLNKQAVITTLQKDFDMLLMRQLANSTVATATLHHRMYYAIEAKNETDYYITDSLCTQLLLIQKASKRKPKVDMRLFDVQQGVPDSVHIKHHQFSFTITLKKLQR